MTAFLTDKLKLNVVLDAYLMVCMQMITEEAAWRWHTNDTQGPDTIKLSEEEMSVLCGPQHQLQYE